MNTGRTAAEEAYHRELYNRSRDIIRVYNPLEKEFAFKYDGIWFRIAPKSYQDWEQYLVIHYFNKISEYIIGQKMIEQGNKMLEERRQKGLVEFLDKYEENRAIWDKAGFVLHNKELREQIASEVIVGLVKEYGKEPPPPEEQPARVSESFMSLGDQIATQFSKRPVDTSKPAPIVPIIRPLTQKPTKDMEEEVTVEDEPKTEGTPTKK